jgi:glycosidase
MEPPLAKQAIVRYGLAPAPAEAAPAASHIATARRIAARVNAARPPGTPSVQTGELAALALLHEIFHLLVAKAAETDPTVAMPAATEVVGQTLGTRGFDALVQAAAGEFPDLADRPTPAQVEELLLLRVANENPALGPLHELVDDTHVQPPERDRAVATLEELAASARPIGPNGETLVELLRAPARAHPTSLAGQLRWIREHWAGLLGDALEALLGRMLMTLDVIAEDERGLHLRFGGGGAGDGGGRPDVSDFSTLGEEPERFSHDDAWMPRLVLMAKSSHVWLDQLSRTYGREIRSLDAVPDEELDRLARYGVTGLWLIGLWERSRASQRIKAWRGNPDAAASAYSLDDYRIADDLGGEGAWLDLRDRAWARGIRLSSDMVPNHMGIDSRWVIEHPDWFISLPHPPYPGYTYQGENLADDDRVEVRLEDHYWDNSDAAVTFERRDRATGERRYVYHGNDGTSFPWNDTAQLDFSSAEVREEVIQTILAVARRFPVIRFDAAMVLAKKHVRRLWFPEPGSGGAIPSRAEHGAMSADEFDRRMPQEFWREVVDRVAAEAPGTLLLAEAFWLMEGFFVRTLGMHRVYNSAFMHMLRDEDNAGYRRVMKDTLEFDPEILKRYVNFMSNPDEKTAVEQFGKGDKYFGVATLMATLPGLPMLGHGQFEGYAEKYGMEFRRAAWGEQPDEALVAAHERLLAPLLHRRGDYAEVRDFLLYDVTGSDGHVRDDVFAYSNGSGPSRSLVVYHNRFGDTEGWIRESSAYAEKGPDGTKRQVRRTLADGLRLPGDGPAWLRYRDQRAGLEYLRSVGEVRDRGLHVSLRAYQTMVFGEFHELADPAGIWARLAEQLAGAGVPSLDEALLAQSLAPVHEALRAVAADAALDALVRGGRSSIATLAAPLGAFIRSVRDATGTTGDPDAVAAVGIQRLDRMGARISHASPGAAATHRAGARDPLSAVAAAFTDPWHRAVLAAWAVLEPLGGLASGAMVGPTSRAWFDELRLGPALARALRDRGLDEAQAWAAAERVRLLLAIARPTNVGGRTAPERARRLTEAWLDGEDTRAFLRVNTWEGVDWFARDAWRELLDWVLLLDLLDADGAAATSSSTVVGRLVEAGEASGFRVDRLRASLAPARSASRATSATAPAPRRPRKSSRSS